MKIQCASNLKQWGLAVNMYAGDNRERFPDNTGGLDLAWMDPNFNTNFYPIYLYKNRPGTKATAQRGANRNFMVAKRFSFCFAQGLTQAAESQRA